MKIKINILIFSLLFGLIVSLTILLYPQERQIKVVSKAKRIALVIGNNNYTQGKLANAVNDSRGMRDILKNLGFTVLYRENSSLREITTAVQDFGNKLKKGGVGLFYFSGHGLQIKGQNFLLPIGVDIKSEGDVPYEGYPADRLLSALEVSGNKLNIIILDACRDNPFARSFSRSTLSGLAQMQSGKGMLIAYATSPGDTASDGPGMKNGLFTYHLIENLRISGLSLSKLFDITREKVFKASKENQLPWVSTSVIGDFIFNSGRIANSQSNTSPCKPKLPSETKIDLSHIEVKAKQKEKEQKEWSKRQTEYQAAFDKIKIDEKTSAEKRLKISVCIITKEFNLGKKLNIFRIKPVVQNYFLMRRISLCKIVSDANFVVEIEAQSRKGTEIYGLYSAFADCTIAIRNIKTGDEIYHQIISNIKGLDLNYEKAGLKAFKNLTEKIENILPEVVKHLLKEL